MLLFAMLMADFRVYLFHTVHLTINLLVTSKQTVELSVSNLIMPNTIVKRCQYLTRLTWIQPQRPPPLPWPAQSNPQKHTDQRYAQTREHATYADTSLKERIEGGA
jgi:hypothetical protein